MNKLIALLLLATFPAYGQVLPSNKVKLGDKTASNKTIEMDKGLGAANPKLRWSETDAKLQFSNDGTNFKALGSGSGSGQGIGMLADYNADFEAGLANWTASGGSVSVGTGSNALFEAKSGIWDASAASQTFENSTVAILNGLKGTNGYASCWFKTTASDYKIQVLQAATVLGERTIPALSAAAEIGMYFPFPASGNVKLQIISGSNAAAITVDNCFLGSSSMAQVGSAEIVATLNMPGYYSTSSLSMVDMALTGGADATATGKCSFGTASSTELVCPSLAPGKYTVSVLGGTLRNGGGGASGAAMQISDGGSTSGTISMVTQSDVGYKGAPASIEWAFSLTSATAKTFKLQLQATGTGTATYSGDGAQIIVKRFPLESEQAVKIETIANNYSGFLYGANWSTASGSYVVPSYNGPSVALAVSDSNGISCVENGANPELTCTVPILGKYEACLQGTIGVTTALEIGEIRLVSGGDELAETAVYGSTNTQGIPFNICGAVTPTSLSFVLSTEVKVSGGATAILQYGNTPLRFTLKPLSQQIPAPILVGGVVSSAQGVTRLESAAIGSIGAVIDQSGGDWIDGGVVAHPSTGQYTLTFKPGLFSTSISPKCVIGGIDNGTQEIVSHVEGFNPTSVTYQIKFAGTLTDLTHSIICTGPK